MNAKDIEQLISDNMPVVNVTVASEDDHHFQAVVVSQAFQGKKSLERQRMVYASLGENITNGTIHALSLKTYTEEEWQNP